MELVTANGKELQVIPTGKGYWKIQFTTGGELPEILSGIYLSKADAEIAALIYVEKSKEKTKKPKEE